MAYDTVYRTRAGKIVVYRAGDDPALTAGLYYYRDDKIAGRRHKRIAWWWHGLIVDERRMSLVADAYERKGNVLTRDEVFDLCAEDVG